MKFDSVSNTTSHQSLNGRAFPVSISINPLVMKQVDVTEFPTRGLSLCFYPKTGGDRRQKRIRVQTRGVREAKRIVKEVM